MFLHEHAEEFDDVLRSAAERYNISAEIAEKDYFVSMLLKSLYEVEPRIIFRGGTSLSKSYRLIERFSEDIDLSLLSEAGKMTQGEQRALKLNIVAAAEQLGFCISNMNEIRSKRKFNRYRAAYRSIYERQSISHEIVIEVFLGIPSFPVDKRPIYSYAGEVLAEYGQEETIEAYGLQPFSMRVQDIQRTFVDKVFALCDYHLASDTARHSRHIYDIYQIMQHINLSEMKALIAEVRRVRKNNRKCLSAQDDVNVTDLLREIVKYGVYREDYEQITRQLLFRPISYEQAIQGVEKLIEEQVFFINKADRCQSVHLPALLRIEYLSIIAA